MTLHRSCLFIFFFNDTATTEIYTLSLHDALPISSTVRTPARSSGASPELRPRASAARPRPPGTPRTAPNVPRPAPARRPRACRPRTRSAGLLCRRTSFAQCLPQQPARPEQLRLRRAHRDPRELRDLVMAVALHIVQHEHLPSAPRERRDRALQIQLYCCRTGRVSRSLQRRRVSGGEDAQRAPPTRPLAQKHDVHGEPVQPGRECALAPEAREPLPRPHERVLRELLGARAIGREAQTERVHPTHVRAVQRLERGLVALLRTLDEIARIRLHRVAGDRKSVV